jgi:hypothetical protein
MSRDRQVLHRQPPYCSVACVRTGCQAGTVLHQHSGEWAAQSNGREQLAHFVFMGSTIAHALAARNSGLSLVRRLIQLSSMTSRSSFVSC